MFTRAASYIRLCVFEFVTCLALRIRFCAFKIVCSNSRVRLSASDCYATGFALLVSSFRLFTISFADSDLRVQVRLFAFTLLASRDWVRAVGFKLAIFCFRICTVALASLISRDWLRPLCSACLNLRGRFQAFAFAHSILQIARLTLCIRLCEFSFARARLRASAWQIQVSTCVSRVSL